MTGRDLIIYILQNNLENEPVIKDGQVIGFMSLTKAAEKFEVGEATIFAWLKLGMLNGFELDGNVLIPANSKKPGDSK